MNITIIGSGAQAKYALEILYENEYLHNIEIISSNENHIGDILYGYKILRYDDSYHFKYKHNVFISHGNNKIKEDIYNNINIIPYIILPKLIHKRSYISTTSKVSNGSLINPFAVIQPFAEIGICCMIHAGVIIEHNCKIDDFVNISPGVSIAGGVEIGKRSYIFTGSKIIPNIKIGKDSIVAAGSVVTKDVPDNVMVAGCPAVIKKKL